MKLRDSFAQYDLIADVFTAFGVVSALAAACIWPISSFCAWMCIPFTLACFWVVYWNRRKMVLLLKNVDVDMEMSPFLCFPRYVTFSDRLHRNCICPMSDLSDLLITVNKFSHRLDEWEEKERERWFILARHKKQTESPLGPDALPLDMFKIIHSYAFNAQ